MSSDRPWRLQAVSKALFSLFVTLALATPSWRVGIFTWLPFYRFSMLAGEPATFGVLSLLPVSILVLWAAQRWLERSRRPWYWGRLNITLPLLGVTLLTLLGLEPTATWRTIVQLVGLSLFWIVYLFVVNQKPSLTGPLAVVVLLQGCVAVAQFLLQSDLGLQPLGELQLDPSVTGVSVLGAGGRRWLRGYGLTAHPNVLGAMLAIQILLLLAGLRSARHWRRVALLFVIGVGLIGVLVSFSRASWLGLAVGLVAWFRDPALRKRLRWAGVLVLFVTPLFLWRYRHLVLSRFTHLNAALEARSLNERWRDLRLALQLIQAHPWRGVGVGLERIAAQHLNPYASTVHNVPLLVTAELGLPGALCYLWLAVAGLSNSYLAFGPWLAMLVIGMFDNALWLTSSWQAAILLALLSGSLPAGSSALLEPDVGSWRHVRDEHV